MTSTVFSSTGCTRGGRRPLGRTAVRSPSALGRCQLSISLMATRPQPAAGVFQGVQTPKGVTHPGSARLMRRNIFVCWGLSCQPLKRCGDAFHVLGFCRAQPTSSTARFVVQQYIVHDDAHVRAARGLWPRATLSAKLTALQKAKCVRSAEHAHRPSDEKTQVSNGDVSWPKGSSCFSLFFHHAAGPSLQQSTRSQDPPTLMMLPKMQSKMTTPTSRCGSWRSAA